MADAADVVGSMANRKEVNAAEFPAKLLKLIFDDHDRDTVLKRFHDTIVAAWSVGGIPHKWKDAKCLRRRIGQGVVITGASAEGPMPA